MFDTIYKFIIYFFFHDSATTEIYTLSLHDALPIYLSRERLGERALDLLDDMANWGQRKYLIGEVDVFKIERRDRKSTRLNSSHVKISYAVFCLKKKKKTK